MSYLSDSKVCDCASGYAVWDDSNVGCVHIEDLVRATLLLHVMFEFLVCERLCVEISIFTNLILLN
jgi:hypothetical protein